MPKKRKRIKPSDFSVVRDAAGQMDVIEGPVQMAIIVPMIPSADSVKVEPMRLSELMRDSIENLLLEHGLLYRGVGVKIMKERMPENMKKELIDIRDNREDYLKKKAEASNTPSLKRVRRAWEELWKG